MYFEQRNFEVSEKPIILEYHIEIIIYFKITYRNSIYIFKGLVQCYLDLDNVNTALNFVRGALYKQPDFGNMLLEMQAEPLWRLGQYEELDNLLKKPDLRHAKSWGVEMGRTLLFFKDGMQKYW